jgi:hypothetical protein
MDFNEKADAILAEGRAQRGEYDPEPGSVPYRLYQDYVSRGGRVPPQENFCHFWRVVVFWAPLMWLRDKTVNTDGFKSFMRTKVGGAASVIGNVIATPFRLAGRVERAAKDKWGDENVDDFGWIVLFTLMGLFVLTFLVGIGTSTSWWVPLVIVAGLAALFGMIVGLAELATRAADKNRIAQNAAWEAYFNDEGPRPGSKVRKEPGKIKKFFIAIKDFLVLAVQVVRVKKWKICPLVNIEPQA